jgi:hypothetical protein
MPLLTFPSPLNVVGRIVMVQRTLALAACHHMKLVRSNIIASSNADWPIISAKM